MHSSGALQVPILPRITTFSSGPGHTIPASCSRRCFSAKSGLKMASMTDSGVLDSCEQRKSYRGRGTTTTHLAWMWKSWSQSCGVLTSLLYMHLDDMSVLNDLSGVCTVLTECTLGPYTQPCCLDRSASRPRGICSGTASHLMALANPGLWRQHKIHWIGCRHCTYLQRPRRIDSALGHCLVEAPRRKHGIHPDLPSLTPGNLKSP